MEQEEKRADREAERSEADSPGLTKGKRALHLRVKGGDLASTGAKKPETRAELLVTRKTAGKPHLPTSRWLWLPSLIH